MLPLLHGADEVVEGGEGRPLAPHAQPDHVGHVAGLRSARGGRVHHARVGQPVLQLEGGEARLGGLRRTHRTQVLRLVALVKHNLFNVG